MTTVRRTFLKNTAAALAGTSAAWPALNFAQTPARQTFAPQSGAGAPSRSQHALTSSSRRA